MNVSKSISNQYNKLKQKQVTAKDTFPHVELLSYHLPKTAGTSLYLALENAYGKRHIRRLYNREEIDHLIDGLPLWVNKNTRAIHGHFQPQHNHVAQYPNAKRIIWVRDPINWYWSTLQHYLWQKNGRVYQEIYAKYLSQKEYTTEELFLSLIKDPAFNKMRLYFYNFCKRAQPSDFDFVGRTEDYENELERLGKLLGKELTYFAANKNPRGETLTISRKELYPYFESQYKFLVDFFGIEYSI